MPAQVLPFPPAMPPLGPQGPLAAQLGQMMPGAMQNMQPGLMPGMQPPMGAPQPMPQQGVQGPVASVVRYDYVGEDPNDEEREPGEGVEHSSVRVSAFRKQYTDYTTIKADEMAEARDALAFYDGDQWSSEELKKLNARGQPPMTFNRIDKKIDSLVGTIQRLRGDPRCFGRNAPDEAGAEVATQCIRYCLDISQWTAVEAEALVRGLCMGYVVAEIVLVPGDKGDPDIEIAAVDQTAFYYDPRSTRLDFTDCRYMGVSKFFTEDEFNEFWPDQWDQAVGSLEDLGYNVFDSDKSYLWSQGKDKIRVVEHWYRCQGEWRFCYFCGDLALQAGKSPFFDEKGKTVSRYLAFAIKIDASGDHYGFVRTLKGPQQAMNQHRSKAVHIMNTRQLITRRGSLGGDDLSDIEDIRREIARPDGVVIWDGPVENKPEFASQQQEFLQQSQYYADAKQEIDNFGPSSAAMMSSMMQQPDVSGRVLDMQQRAGLSEMGQFLTQWRNWRQKLYRLIWTQQQRNWTGERVLRVTDDQGMAQYVSINAVRTDQWNRPVTVNMLGALDVDIIADEGPDTANVMGSVYDMLVVLAQQKIPIPPEMLIESSALPSSKKREFTAMLNKPPDPQTQAAQNALLQNKNADTAKKLSGVEKDKADAEQARAGAIHRLALSHHEVQKAQNTERDTATTTLQAGHSHDMDLMDRLLMAASTPPAPTGMPGQPPAGPQAAPGGGMGGPSQEPAPMSPLGLPPAMPGGPGGPGGGPLPGG